MENKTDFLDKALRLFYLNGAKTTTMDDIAREFSMSKKTLYQLYANKDELLEEVLSYELELIMKTLQNFDNQEECPIKKMLCRDEKIKDLSESSNHSIFARQLKKYYYHLFEKQANKIENAVAQMFAKNVKKGRALELYRGDFQAEEYAKFFMLIVFSYDDSPLVDTEKISRHDYTQSAIVMMLNAMTTEKGKKQLNEYLKISGKP